MQSENVWLAMSRKKASLFHKSAAYDMKERNSVNYNRLPRNDLNSRRFFSAHFLFFLLF